MLVGEGTATSVEVDEAGPSVNDEERAILQKGAPQGGELPGFASATPAKLAPMMRIRVRCLKRMVMVEDRFWLVEGEEIFLMIGRSIGLWLVEGTS